MTQLRKSIKWCFLLMIMFAGMLNEAVCAESKPITLAVLDFRAKKPQGQNLSMLIFAGLAEVDKVSLVERKKMAAIIKEQKLSASGLCSKRGALKLGGLAGADYVLTGRIYALEGKIFFNAKFIDCRNGRITGISRSYPGNKKTSELLSGFADAVVAYVKKKLHRK